jgi:hypothetical protein
MFAFLITELFNSVQFKAFKQVVSNPSGINHNTNQKQSPKHKAKIGVCTQNIQLQQPKKEKISDFNFVLRTKRNFILLYSLSAYFAEGNKK